MSRKSERDFVGEGLSDEDFAALNGDVGQDVDGDENAVVAEPPQETPPTEGVTPPAEATPAQETAAKPEPEPKMVDIRALQEARAELRRRDEEFARLDERLKALNEVIAKRDAPKPETPAIPDPEKEPWEHLQYELKTAKDRIQAFEEAQNRSAAETEQARSRQLVLDRADMTLAQARTTNPDMDEAFNFTTEAVKKEIDRRLRVAGLTGQAYVQKFNDVWNATLMQYAAECPQDPNEAAEHIRRHARYWGWTGVKQPDQTAAAVVQPGAVPAAIAPPVQQPTIQQRAEQQQRHMSLTNVPGSETPKRLSAKDLAGMSDKEYMALLKTAAGRQLAEEEFGGV